MTIQQINNFQDFKKTVEGGVCIIKFTATWCGPCKKIAPKFIEFSNKFENIGFYEVDVDDSEDISQYCDIKCMPTFQAWKDGEPLYIMEGASESELLQLLQKI
mgnify:CR=1 FL=1|jgi:thioredoxin 1